MNEEPYQADDPSFLLSRALDEELTEAQRRRLEEALADSPALRLEASTLRSVDRLLKGWAGQRIKIDEAAFEAGVLARVADEAHGEALGKVDNLLKRWSRHRPVVDEEAFVQAVLGQIGPTVRVTPWRRRILRLGLPLAAAAVVAIAVTARIGLTPAHAPVVRVAIGRTLPAPGGSQDHGRAQPVVSFARAPVDVSPTPFAEPGVSFIAVGASPIATNRKEGYPL